MDFSPVKNLGIPPWGTAQTPRKARKSINKCCTWSCIISRAIADCCASPYHDTYHNLSCSPPQPTASTMRPVCKQGTDLVCSFYAIPLYVHCIASFHRRQRLFLSSIRTMADHIQVWAPTFALEADPAGRCATNIQLLKTCMN